MKREQRGLQDRKKKKDRRKELGKKAKSPPSFSFCELKMAERYRFDILNELGRTREIKTREG